MKDENLEIFVECSSEYFKVVTEKSASVGAPFLTNDINKHLYDYTGIIGISGGYKGSVFFSAPKSMLVRILSFFGVLSVDENKLMDLVGEVSNTISGNVRKEFGDQFMLSTPVVLKGKSEDVQVTKVERIYIIPIVWRQYQANLIINIE